MASSQHRLLPECGDEPGAVAAAPVFTIAATDAARILGQLFRPPIKLSATYGINGYNYYYTDTGVIPNVIHTNDPSGVG